MSRVKNRVKNATVERRVQSKRMVVNMNQPCIALTSCSIGENWVLYHQEETKRVVERCDGTVGACDNSRLDIEPAWGEDNCKGNPEATVRR